MTNIDYVDTRKKLKKAIQNKVQYISITEQNLAIHVEKIKKTSKAALVALSVGAGVTAIMIWNPIGWFAGLGTAAFSGVVAASFAYLYTNIGSDAFWGLYGGYKIIGHRIAKLEDNTVVEGDLILAKRNWKRKAEGY